MGRQNGQTSVEIRKLVIKHHLEGKTVRKIADIVKKSRSTVHDIIKRYKTEGRIENKQKISKRKIFNDTDERWLLRKIKEAPTTSAPKLTQMAQEYLSKTCHPETVRNVLRKHNFHGRIARKKPFINKTNRLRRLNFAKDHKNKDFDFWKTVIFADESKFNLFSSDGKVCVWRRPNEELKLKNLKPTVKHGGGSVLVWGCMAASGVGQLRFIDGIMDQNVYLDILNNCLLPSAEKLGLRENFTYYQDNDPKHTAGRVRRWLIYKCPHVMKTPAQSPDLNVIEHMWDHLDKAIRKRHITNKNDLKQVLQEEWNKIPNTVCENLVKSIPRRLNAVIKTRGGPTKY